jgi:hypothetical protein
MTTKLQIDLAELIKIKYLEYYIMGGHAWRDGYFDSDELAKDLIAEHANPYQLIIANIKQIKNPFPKELPTNIRGDFPKTNGNPSYYACEAMREEILKLLEAK